MSAQDSLNQNASTRRSFTDRISILPPSGSEILRPRRPSLSWLRPANHSLEPVVEMTCGGKGVEGDSASDPGSGSGSELGDRRVTAPIDGGADSLLATYNQLHPPCDHWTYEGHEVRPTRIAFLVGRSTLYSYPYFEQCPSPAGHASSSVLGHSHQTRET